MRWHNLRWIFYTILYLVISVMTAEYAGTNLKSYEECKQTIHIWKNNTYVNKVITMTVTEYLIFQVTLLVIV